MIFKLAAKKIFSYGEKRAMELRQCYKAFIDGFISFPLNIPGTAHYASMRVRKYYSNKSFIIRKNVIK